MNSIIALTRGYETLDRYNDLIERNKSIFRFLPKYPLILFHEGNISLKHQYHIREKSPNESIEFINISEVWNKDYSYESMCRFYAYHVWNYLSDYDYVLRVDEDCIIEKLESDTFETIEENVYLKSKYWGESHTETNATLPQKIEELTGVKKEEFYNNKFPYTNIGLSSVNFWLEPELNAILKKIAISPDQTINRWGDLPVLGSLLNIYAIGRVGTIQGLTYKHLSHGNIVISEP